MKLPSYVHRLPTFLNFWGGRGYKLPVTGTILLRKDIYDDLMSKSPSPISISLLIHEEEHRKNMKVGSSLKYAVSRRARLEEELNAYRIQFAYLKKHKETYDLDFVARKLSGLLYFYSTDYENAKKQLEKTWEEA